MKEIIGKESSFKKTNFCCAKDNASRVRRQTTDHEKRFAKETSDKRLLSKIY
jgi:hypothetical protein